MIQSNEVATELGTDIPSLSDLAVLAGSQLSLPAKDNEGQAQCASGVIGNDSSIFTTSPYNAAVSPVVDSEPQIAPIDQQLGSDGTLVGAASLDGGDSGNSASLAIPSDLVAPPAADASTDEVVHSSQQDDNIQPEKQNRTIGSNDPSNYGWTDAEFEDELERLVNDEFQENEAIDIEYANTSANESINVTSGHPLGNANHDAISQQEQSAAVEMDVNRDHQLADQHGVENITDMLASLNTRVDDETATAPVLQLSQIGVDRTSQMVTDQTPNVDTLTVASFVQPQDITIEQEPATHSLSS